MILLLWCLLVGCPAPQPKCPPLHDVVVPHYVSQEQYFKDHKHGATWVSTNENGEVTAFWFATGTSDGRILDGTTTDTNAVAYNKRVEECRTLNGQF